MTIRPMIRASGNGTITLNHNCRLRRYTVTNNTQQETRHTISDRTLALSVAVPRRVLQTIAPMTRNNASGISTPNPDGPPNKYGSASSSTHDGTRHMIPNTLVLSLVVVPR